MAANLAWFELQAAIRWLGHLAPEWTDQLPHDPGITILEQLCFALTDLAYRTQHPVADLIAASEQPGLPGPAQILTCEPVTFRDLRVLVLDVQDSAQPAIENVWIDPADESGVPVYYHSGSYELRLEPDETCIEVPPVRLSGLHHVRLQLGPSAVLEREQKITEVARRVHGHRPLCEDFHITALEAFPIRLSADIEIDNADDPLRVLDDIVEQIDACLAPHASFERRADARARGATADTLFEGPASTRGLADKFPALRRSVHLSDLLHSIMDVAHVRAVPVINLLGAVNTGKLWSVDVPLNRVATLDLESQLSLRRAGMPLALGTLQASRTRIESRRRSVRSQSLETLEPPKVTGRDRNLAKHLSLRRQLPAVYGVGPLGLGPGVSGAQRARVEQLKAYLLIFDQLLSNALAQLAQAHTLLSPASDSIGSYFGQAVDDGNLSAHELLQSPPAPFDSHAGWLDAHVGPAASPDLVGPNRVERRSRFLAHLLARFGEQLGEHAWVELENAEARAIASREAFLQDIARLSGARGTGADVLAEGAPTRLSSGTALADRLRLKGLNTAFSDATAPSGFFIVEHILLRPVAEDEGQVVDHIGDPQVPLLAAVESPDPFSLQLSCVFRGAAPTDSPRRDLIERMLQAEVPAHLRIRQRWLDAQAFCKLWHSWRAFHTSYRAYRLAGASPSEPIIHLRARDNRDRVLEGLGIALTYPLRDIPFTKHLIVAPGSSATVALEYSQLDVSYTLCHADTGVAAASSSLVGTGAPLRLQTPVIDQDTRYRIRATKIGSDPAREVWLRGTLQVTEGVDRSLTAELVGVERFSRADEAPVWIADFGREVQAVVHRSQEGVVYDLVDSSQGNRPLSVAVVGIGPSGPTQGDIVLTLLRVDEDVDVRVRARLASLSGQPSAEEALLDAVLALRVRADPTLIAQLGAQVIDFGANASVSIAPCQVSASYTLSVRPLQDLEFAPSQHHELVRVPVGEGRPDLDVWPDRTQQRSEVDAPQPGSAGRVELPAGAFTQDALVIVHAAKEHQVGGRIERSSVELQRALIQLVRPDSHRALVLSALTSAEVVTGPWLVLDGQPGVFYELRVDSGAIALPAYFHQQDELAPFYNKGHGRLRIGADFVITRDRPLGDASDLTITPPLAPRLHSTPIPSGSLVRVSARKAMTSIDAMLVGTVVVSGAPKVRLEPATVAPGGRVLIMVEQSVPGDRYELLEDGQPRYEALVGDGADLGWESNVLTRRTEFTLVIRLSHSPQLSFVRRIDRVAEVEGEP